MTSNRNSFLQNASKYKYAVGKPGKRDQWYTELGTSASVTTAESSNGLKASKRWIAFRSASGVGCVDLHAPGKKNEARLVNLPVATATDFDFSPFDDDLLAIGGEDGQVSVWNVDPSEASTEAPIQLAALPRFAKRVEAVQFHTTANHLLAIASHQTVHIWDVDTQQPTITLAAHEDAVQAISWRENGALLATNARDSLLRIWDPRQQQCVLQGKSHAGNKASRVLWLGNKELVFTVGFSQSRQREYALFDIRSDLSKPLIRQQMESSSSISMPVYDQDTEIVYMVGKGDTGIKRLEIGSVETPPITTETPTIIVPSPPISGIALTPKRCLNIMEAEIARILCLTNDGIVPVSVQVPRKTYRDFHAELFPDTRGDVPACTASTWFKDSTATFSVGKVDLDPIKGNLVQSNQRHAPEPPQQPTPTSLSTIVEDKVLPTSKSTAETSKETSSTTLSRQATNLSEQMEQLKMVDDAPLTSSQSRRSSLFHDSSAASSPSARRVSLTLGGLVRSSAFRYIAGKPRHPREHFEGLRCPTITLSGESNVLDSNDQMLAFPLSGSGGRVGLLRADHPGRVSTQIPAVVAGSDLLDFTLSRMQTSLLCTGSEDGRVRVWNVQLDDLLRAKDMDTPVATLSGHMNRVNLVRLHPFASNVLLSASPELTDQNATIRLWDLEAQKQVRKLDGFTDGVLGCAWAMDGSGQLAVASKNKKLSIWDPRAEARVSEGPSHENPRACRVLWIDDKLVTVGFGKGSQREMNVYASKNLASGPIFTLPIDVSPSVLIPHYDEDTQLIYLCGRGDTSIIPVECTLNETTPLHVLARYDSPNASIQHGTSFLPKRKLDVRNVEVARCWRLSQNNIEPVSFTVPRNRKEFFQEDLYPLSRDYEQASMTSQDYFATGVDRLPERSVHLQPEGMQKLSEAPPVVKAERKYHLPNGDRVLTDNERQQKFIDEMFSIAKADDNNVKGEKPLPQDLMEGVDPSEWDD